MEPENTAGHNALNLKSEVRLCRSQPDQHQSLNRQRERGPEFERILLEHGGVQTPTPIVSLRSNTI
jgi:hypothetical protein